VDGTFISANKGVRSRQNQARQRKQASGMADGAGTLLGVLAEATVPSEVTLLRKTVRQVPWDLLDAQPEGLVIDRAYDSKSMRNDVAECGIE
jgi:hypothetical protein